MNIKNLTLTAVILFGATTMAATADSTKALNGTMVPTFLSGKLSAEALKAMDQARADLLNNDSTGEVSWTDGKGEHSGVFAIANRYQMKDSNERCREYNHVIKDRSGQPVINPANNRPVRMRDVVCFQNSAWVKYQGDRSLLNPESATDKPATGGPVGPEHRRQHPNMIGPIAMGQVVDAYKLFEKAAAGYSTDEEKQQVREQMYNWTREFAKQMSEAQKTMALDQLALVLTEVRLDSAKMEIVKILRPQLNVKVGEAKKVAELFVNAKRKSEVAKLLK